MKKRAQHWRTSILGLLLGIATIAYPYLMDKEITRDNVVGAVVLGILGTLAKDNWLGYGNNCNKETTEGE